MTAAYVQGPADQSGKAWATEEVTQSGAPNSNKAHIQKILIANADGTIQDEYPIAARSQLITPVTGSCGVGGSVGHRVSANIEGLTGATIVYSGTFTGTTVPVFEVSMDGGVNYVSTTATQVGGLSNASIEAVATVLSSGIVDPWVITIPPGATHVATYMLSGPATGTVDVRITAGMIKVANAVTTRTFALGTVGHDAGNDTNVVQVGGHAATAKPTDVAAGDRSRVWTTLAGAQVVAGYDGSAVRHLLTDTSGRLLVSHDITGIGDDRKVVTTAGTRVTLASSTTAKSVVITAETDNTGVIVVGGTTVVASLSTRRGTPLNAGDSITIPCDNLNDINLDATVSGDGVTFTYFT